jgi:hypothetical protein
MLDRFVYKCFGFLDDAISFVETYAVKLTSWLWEKRVKILKRKRKNERH